LARAVHEKARLLLDAVIGTNRMLRRVTASQMAAGAIQSDVKQIQAA
jgi:hypothetical protein